MVMISSFIIDVLMVQASIESNLYKIQWEFIFGEAKTEQSIFTHTHTVRISHRDKKHSFENKICSCSMFAISFDFIQSLQFDMYYVYRIE